ncbi:MAG: 1,4-dihydroxy-2-naphthoate octaprenyltransferase [bacterium]
MDEGHSRAEISSVLDSVDTAAVSTFAGDRMRSRMMHYAADEEFNIYLATMKGDPKTAQITHHPSVSLLIHKHTEDVNDSMEVEVTGKAFVVKDDEERQTALEATAQRSPVVKYLVETGHEGMLDCIRVVPECVKFRVFKEIVQGMPPTVIEFPENRLVVRDFDLLKRKVKSWVIGLRASFLTATIVPILLGAVIAWVTTAAFHWGYFLLTMLGGLFLHAGTNVINDYSDHRSGNDEVNLEFVRPFSGGSRVIQLGLLTPLEVLVGGLALFLLGSLMGLYLAWVRGPLILALGVIGIASGMFYSGKPFDWASKGIGEMLVGLNFGVLMTLGAYYVQTQELSWVPVMAGIPVAFFIAAVLYINEFPDYQADKVVGKKTLVVRLGRQKAVIGYVVLIMGAYLSILAGVVTGVLAPVALAGLATLPLSVRAIHYARRHYAKSFDLVPANALTIIAHLATGLLLTLAYSWIGFGAQGRGYVAVLGLGFGLFVFYMYRYIERQKEIFLGLKEAMR